MYKISRFKYRLYRFSVSKITTILLAYLSFFLLIFSFFLFGPLFQSYVRFEVNFDEVRFIISLALFSITLLFLPKSVGKISHSLNLVIFLISILPVFVLYCFDPLNPWFILLITLTFWLQCFILRHVNIKSKSHSPFSFHTSNVLNGATLFCSLFVLLMIFQFGLPDWSNLSFDKISNVRTNFDGSGFLYTIILPIMCRLIIPLLLAISISKKNYFRVLILVSLQLFVYFITGFKTFLFICVIVVICSLLKVNRLFNFIIIGFNLMVLAVIVCYSITDNNMIPGLFFNRLLFLPAMIKFNYFDFFSSNSFLYASQTTIGSVLHLINPYQSPIPNIIGDVYFGSFDMYCNTGYVLDGFANFGLIGSVVASASLSLILLWIESATINLNKILVFSVFVSYMVSLNDGSLFTILMSGGFLICICFFQFFDLSKFSKKVESYYA